MKERGKEWLVRYLRIVTKILIILISCVLTFIGMLILLLPIFCITGGGGHLHDHGEMERVFRFSKTLVYAFVGWIESVLIWLVGYARYIGRIAKSNGEKIINPVAFWKEYTNNQETVHREKWVTESNPDQHAQEFLALCKEGFKLMIDFRVVVRAKLEKVTMEELQNKYKASIVRRYKELKQDIGTNREEMSITAETGEVAMLFGAVIGTAMLALKGALSILIRTVGIGVGYSLFWIKYLLSYGRHIVMALCSQKERIKNPAAFWEECYSKKTLIGRKDDVQLETLKEKQNKQKEEAE